MNTIFLASLLLTSVNFAIGGEGGRSLKAELAFLLPKMQHERSVDCQASARSKINALTFSDGGYRRSDSLFERTLRIELIPSGHEGIVAIYLHKLGDGPWKVLSSAARYM